MTLFSQLEDCILNCDADEKCKAVDDIFTVINDGSLHLSDDLSIPPKIIGQPGMPSKLRLVPPRELAKRSIQQQDGRNVLMHAIAHIEFNAINLALDAAYRFRNQPREFYLDWISVAADEAKHFQLIQGYLQDHHMDYGDLPAHNGLWEMAVDTAHDVVARMALVPRVLEARGLDVTPGIIRRLQHVDDQAAISILKVIYEDEIRHVGVGSKWFTFQCAERGLETRTTFKRMVERYLHGDLKGPFNIEARLLAGFDAEELQELIADESN